MRRLLPPDAHVSDGGRERPLLHLRAPSAGAFSVDFEGNRLVDTERLDLALEMVEAGLRRHVAEHAPGRVFVHAGCVAAGDIAIVFPGRTFAGKSTLTAALLAAGADYFSDEYAVLDDSGLVHAYPRSLSLRPGGRRNQVEVSPAALGARVSREPRRVGIVVMTRYEPGATWRPVEASPGAGALALVSHAIPARARPEEALDAARAAVRGCLVLKGTRGEADEAAGDLLARARALRVRPAAPT